MVETSTDSLTIGRLLTILGVFYSSREDENPDNLVDEGTFLCVIFYLIGQFDTSRQGLNVFS